MTELFRPTSLPFARCRTQAPVHIIIYNLFIHPCVLPAKLCTIITLIAWLHNYLLFIARLTVKTSSAYFITTVLYLHTVISLIRYASKTKPCFCLSYYRMYPVYTSQGWVNCVLLTHCSVAATLLGSLYTEQCCCIILYIAHSVLFSRYTQSIKLCWTFRARYWSTRVEISFMFIME